MSVPATAVLLVRAVGFQFVLLGGTLVVWDAFLRVTNKPPNMDDRYFSIGISPQFMAPALVCLAFGLAVIFFSPTLARWLSRGTETLG